MTPETTGNKVIDMNRHFNELFDKADAAEDAKSFDFTRDAEPTSSGNELWDEEVKAWADMLTIESLFYTEDWVYIVTDLIAGKISAQPLYVMRKTKDADGVETSEFADLHPLNALMESPNPLQDYTSFMYALVVNYILLGNSVQWYSAANKWLINLRASLVDINFNRKGEVEAYTYANTSGANMFSREASSTRYDPREIIHIRRPNPSSLLWGLSPFVAGRKSILFNRYSSDYLNSFYLKQATPGMVLSLGEKTNEQQALRQLRSFELAYTGRKNQRRTMLLPKGTTATQLSNNIADQRITEIIRTNRETILSLLKVPKHEVGLQEAGSLGSEEYKTALRNFWEATLIPATKMIEGALNKFFKPQLGENFFFKFDLSNVEALRDDQNKKALTAKDMLAAGLSVNEVRTRVWELAATENPLDNAPYVSRPAPGSFVPALPGSAPTSEPASAVPVVATTTPSQSLNGAQVSSLVEVVNRVAQGLIPRESGVEIIRISFALSKEDAEAVMGSVGGSFTPESAPGTAPETFAAPVPLIGALPAGAAEESKVVESATEKLKLSLEQRKQGWLERYVKTLEDVAGKEEKKLNELALETLVSMAEAAAPILAKRLRNTKAADIPSKTKLRKDLQKAFDEFEEKWVDEYVTALTSTVELGYDQQLEFIFNEKDLEKIEVLRSRGADGRREILTERGLESFANVSKTQTEQIMSEITRGVEANETVDQISRRVADTFTNPEAMRARANTIARTETLTAVSVGQGAAFQNAATVIPGLKKAWLNANDDRVRDQHLDKSQGGVSGEVVDASEAFSNGLRWPRDTTSGDASQVINCRCTMLTIVPGMEGEEA